MAGETMSITDLFGLNSPRGLLGNSFGSTTADLYTPPASSGNLQQLNFDESKLSMGSLNSFSTPVKSVPNGISGMSLNGSSLPPQAAVTNPAVRRTSLSDSNGSNSPLGIGGDSSLINNFNARADSPENSDSAISSPDGSLTELMNSLTLNEAVARNCLNSSSLLADLNLTSLHNLQALQTLKYLQQPPAVLNSLLHPACSHNATQILEKFNGNTATLNLMNLASQVQDLHLDRVARYHRTAAAVYDATCTWSGVLPPRSNKPLGYSCKVFLGGVPWDISEQVLIQTFKQFGNIKVEWPGKDKQAMQPKGYVYIIFEAEKNIKALLQACTNDSANSGNWYFKISSKRMKSKEVQVIPWVLNDSNFTKSTSQKLDPSKTVFVGALHGMLNAEGLAKVMNDLFDGVVYAGIDTDKYKYPIGSGRVTFNNPRSYMKAVSAAFIEIKTAKFTKKVQVDPYLEDSLCSYCGIHQGPYFCREMTCFRYFCRPCWQWHHQGSDQRHHKPLMRNSKNSTIVGLGSGSIN
ncbi:hypothetical protein ILUMI_05667 [Ignelater luminosus]|uniref:RRM domain-containing protein n=1 Tax=Ignelater luminosus TaxID=2038154 RepID=A0A8K0D6V2_IGNLU|nr:hypothetical protein ILUMI_05667 [Ignelater luminosus]